MNKIKTRCPAKVNLYLKVLNKRDDRYHNLETSFQLIDLADDMSFEVCDKDISCLLYTSPSPRDTNPSRMPSSA